MSFATKRLVTDAKIVLLNVGYAAFEVESEKLHPRFPYVRKTVIALAVCDKDNAQTILRIIDHCVDNAEVEKLLEAAKK